MAHKDLATAMMSACIIAAQAIMLPVALLVGHYADRIGRKPILLLGFGVLPVRMPETAGPGRDRRSVPF
jgi:MFS family permease